MADDLVFDPLKEAQKPPEPVALPPVGDLPVAPIGQGASNVQSPLAGSMRNYSKTEYDAIGTPTVNTQTTYTGADLAAAKTGTGAERWRPVVVQALAMLGQPASLADGVIRRIAFESGGNPTAINKTDSNARAGHPSQGLMQTIPGTFDTYSGSLKARGINDPLANIYAGLNYAIHRYGSIAAIDPKVRPKGY